MEEKKTIPVTPPVTAARRVFPVDGRDRALLVLAWGVGVLCAEALLWGLSGLGMTLLVAAWYGVLFWYGGAAPLARRENRLLLYAVGLLALTFALFANPWLRLWNTLALVLLMGIQMGGWPGMEVYSVGTSAMLGERFLRVMGGLFGYLGASVQALGSIRGLSRKKMPYVLGALLVCVPLLMVVFPLLTSADALFAQVTRRAADWFDEHLALWALRLIFGLLVAPFLFGLLYSLRRPEPLKRPARPVEGLSMEAAGPVTVLAVLDVLYAFFLAVQCAALFGGADYLAQVGISYASYARSGFFQLVAGALAAEQIGHPQRRHQHQRNVHDDIAEGVPQHPPELGAGENGFIIIQPDKMLLKEAGGRQLIQAVPVSQADKGGYEQGQQGKYQQANEAGHQKGRRGDQPLLPGSLSPLPFD